MFTEYFCNLYAYKLEILWAIYFKYRPTMWYITLLLKTLQWLCTEINKQPLPTSSPPTSSPRTTSSLLRCPSQGRVLVIIHASPRKAPTTALTCPVTCSLCHFPILTSLYCYLKLLLHFSYCLSFYMNVNSTRAETSLSFSLPSVPGTIENAQ